MRKYLLVASTVTFFSCSQKIYVVRHAEKVKQEVGMSADVELSTEGKNRAEELAIVLKKKRIKNIFSTNTTRTKSTAAPLAKKRAIPIILYEAKPDSIFLKKINTCKGNVLVVGHSNTYDDIINLLCGGIIIPTNLQDHEYDNLYEIIKRKGKIMRIENKKYGLLTN